MSDHTDWDRAYKLVGRFMCCWAVVEAGLNSLIRTALGLDVSQGYIVTANISVRDKIFICRTMANSAMQQPDTWKETVDSALKKIADFSADRNMVAHTLFGPTDDGSGVRFLRVVAKGKLVLPDLVWTEDEFHAKAGELMKHHTTLQQAMDGFKRASISYVELAEGLAADTTRPTGGLLSAAARQRQAHQNAPEPKRRLGAQTPLEDPELVFAGITLADLQPPPRPKRKPRSKKG